MSPQFTKSRLTGRDGSQKRITEIMRASTKKESIRMVEEGSQTCGTTTGMFTRLGGSQTPGTVIADANTTTDGRSGGMTTPMSVVTIGGEVL